MENFKKAFTKDDVIEGVEEKSIEEIIREVAEEEGMTVEEVAEAVERLSKINFGVKSKKRHTKPKVDKAKQKTKKKIAKKSRKKNR